MGIYVIFGGTKYAPPQSIYCLIVLILMTQFGLLSAWCWHYNIAWSCCEIWADNTYETLAWLAWLILIVDVALTLILLFLHCMKRLFQAIKTHSLPSSGVEMEVTVNSKSDAVETETAEKEEDEDGADLDGQSENKLVKRATQVF